MPTFETTPRFERDWKQLTRQQQALFRKVVLEVFVPDLAAPDRQVRPGLRVKGGGCSPGRARGDMGRRRPGHFQLRARTDPRPAAGHLAADRNPCHLYPAIRAIGPADGSSRQEMLAMPRQVLDRRAVANPGVHVGSPTHTSNLRYFLRSRRLLRRASV
jgi:hypothetical protein